MIPLKANIQLQVPKGTTVELFALRKPFASLISSDRISPLPLPNQTIWRAVVLLHAGVEVVTSHPPLFLQSALLSANLTIPLNHLVWNPPNAIVASLRSELDATRSELTRFQSDCHKVGREIEDLKRERDFAMADRRSRGPVRDFDRRALRYDARRSSGTRSPSSRTAYDSDHDHDLDELPLMKSCQPVPRTQAAETNLFLRFPDLARKSFKQFQDLNTEIIQLAAGATENGVTSRLGAAFAGLLVSRDHSEEPALLQFGLQACVATCVARLLGVFCVGLPSGDQRAVPPAAYPPACNSTLPSHSALATIPLLKRRWGQLSEPQATSSRWRALTLTHLRVLNPRLEEAAIHDFITQILRAWADVLVLCGCAPSELTLDALRSRYGPQTQRVVRSACALAQVLHEEVMSTNFEVILAKQGHEFDTSCMANAFGTFGETSGTVLCSTELGLRCSTKKNARAAADGLVEGTVDQTMLLLPKVILEGVADILDGKDRADD
ncbi:hypothetical protein EDB92DRAFT_1973104 [Lactarius akahatsu]|uniref:Uncharacterized protein n=1 Tax=Lactarius akahatsu TaxID=416441 RepID=A0AAD4LLH2_9AGAM|nr:hypothetical protein EDB92DRAFT_1973104 [Lactarius akahatsu]